MFTAGALFLAASLAAVPASPSLDEVLDAITWNGQSSLRIAWNGRTLAIDPYRLHHSGIVDAVLITHAHYDHLSLPDLAKVVGPRTIIAAPADCLAQIRPHFPKNPSILMKPGAAHQVIAGIPVVAVPAYNIVRTQCHPRRNGWVGYVLNLGGIHLYDAGDTERIPEMRSIRADIALLPLGQTFTMGSVHEAAEAALDLGAKVVIPIHYGLYEGKDADALELSHELAGRARTVIKTRQP